MCDLWSVFVSVICNLWSRTCIRGHSNYGQLFVSSTNKIMKWSSKLRQQCILLVIFLQCRVHFLTHYCAAVHYCIGQSLHCIAMSLHCIALSLHCIAQSLHCIALPLHCIALSLHCIALSLHIVLHCHCTALHCHCTALHCYCTVIARKVQGFWNEKRFKCVFFLLKFDKYNMLVLL